MGPSARPGPTEGRSSWIAIAALLAALLVFDGWVTLAGRSPGRVPGSLSATALVELEGGQTRTFAPAAAPEGTVLACVHAGLRVAARVPAPGRSVRRVLVPPQGSGRATLTIATAVDGTVRVGCR
jgi:hypothetical protein